MKKFFYMGIALLAMFTLPMTSCSDNDNNDEPEEVYDEIYTNDDVLGSWRLTNYMISFDDGTDEEGTYTGDSAAYYKFNSDGTCETKLYIPNKIFDKQIGNYEVTQMTTNYCAYNNAVVLDSRWDDVMAIPFIMYDDYKAMHWVYADSELLIQSVYEKLDATPTISINPKWLYGGWKCTTVYKYNSKTNSMAETKSAEEYVYFLADGEFRSMDKDGGLYVGNWKIDNETLVLSYIDLDLVTQEFTKYLTSVGSTLSFFIVADDANLETEYRFTKVDITDLPYLMQ